MAATEIVKEPEEIIGPDIVITRHTKIATILLAIAKKGETLNELNLKYIPVRHLKEGEQDPEEVCNTVLRYLSKSFGWYEEEHERKIVKQDFEATEPDGKRVKYQAHVWVIPIHKHGALIHK